MSYQEKRNLVSIITGLFILIAYCVYAYGKYQAGAMYTYDMKFWAGAMLMFIGVGVAATIVIQIAFHIMLSVVTAVQENVRYGKCDEKEIEKTIRAEMVTDEMDKLIELKSMRIGFIAAGIGFIAALVSLVLEYSPVIMLNIIFVSFSAGSLLEGVTQFYFYRRGIKNG